VLERPERESFQVLQKVDWVVIELKRSRREGGRERGKRKDLLRGNLGRFSK
jgi:hypothetical protein